MRALRLALEFSKADLALTEQGIASTVVVFGSSRILSPEQVEEALSRAHEPPTRKRAKQAEELSHWYQEAREFARIVRGGAARSPPTARSRRHRYRRWPGIMEAANHGAAEAGADYRL